MKKIIIFITLFLNIGLCQDTNIDVTVYGGIVDDGVINPNRTSEISRYIYIKSAEKNEISWTKNKQIIQYRLSPDGKYVAVVVMDDIRKGIAIDGSHAYHLYIIDLNGSIVDSIEDGVRFSWNPRGKDIAYIRGLLSSEHPFIFINSGILNIETKETSKMLFKTFELNWSNYDGRIYYYDYATGKTKVYNNTLKTSSSTTLKGIYLSPDGNYCFNNDDESGFRLYSKDNVDITDEFIKNTGIQGYSLQAEWVEGSTLLVKNEKIRDDNRRMNVVYSARDKTFSKFEGKIIGKPDSKKNILLFRDKSTLQYKSLNDIRSNKEN